MKIYTGGLNEERIVRAVEFNMGAVISPTDSMRKCYKQVPCVLDNGAFSSWQRGLPFNETAFLRLLDSAWSGGISVDFIVCPDIVAGGEASLLFSLEWATGRLRTAPRLALVVQDGMTQEMLSRYDLSRFSHIFIGGTLEWKIATGADWVEWAHGTDRPCHIGQVGTLNRLRWAQRIGADSVDSTNFARHGKWSVLEDFYGRQPELFVQG